jgi:hypothetical protein
MVEQGMIFLVFFQLLVRKTCGKRIHMQRIILLSIQEQRMEYLIHIGQKLNALRMLNDVQTC